MFLLLSEFLSEIFRELVFCKDKATRQIKSNIDKDISPHKLRSKDFTWIPFWETVARSKRTQPANPQCTNEQTPRCTHSLHNNLLFLRRSYYKPLNFLKFYPPSLRTTKKTKLTSRTNTGHTYNLNVMEFCELLLEFIRRPGTSSYTTH